MEKWQMERLQTQREIKGLMIQIQRLNKSWNKHEKYASGLMHKLQKERDGGHEVTDISAVAINPPPSASAPINLDNASP